MPKAKKKTTKKKKAAKKSAARSKTKKKTSRAKKQRAPQKEESNKTTLVVLGLIVFGVLAYVMMSDTSAPAAQLEMVNVNELTPSGDVHDGTVVSVLYVGRHANGDIFDTNDAAVAQQEGFEIRNTEPFRFALGTGAVIPGFETAVKSLSVGDRGKFLLPVEQAYGPKDPNKVVEIPRVEHVQRTHIINRTQRVPKEYFVQVFGQEASAGSTVTAEGLPWSFEVVAVTEDAVMVRSNHEVGESVKIPGSAWEATTLAFDQKTVTLRAEAEDGSTMDTPFGPATLEVTEEEILVTISAEIGDTLATGLWAGVVSAVDEETITIDLNSDLAGEDLVFEIELLEIIQDTP